MLEKEPTWSILFRSAASLAIQFGTTSGLFDDASVVDRESAQLEFVEGQMKTLEQRALAAKDQEAKKALKQTMNEMKTRRDGLRDSVKKLKGAAGRNMKLEWKMLGQDIKDDSALKDRVLVFEPSGTSTSH